VLPELGTVIEACSWTRRDDPQNLGAVYAGTIVLVWVERWTIWGRKYRRNNFDFVLDDDIQVLEKRLN
jgi:hypothetical protein